MITQTEFISLDLIEQWKLYRDVCDRIQAANERAAEAAGLRSRLEKLEKVREAAEKILQAEEGQGDDIWPIYEGKEIHNLDIALAELEQLASTAQPKETTWPELKHLRDTGEIQCLPYSREYWLYTFAGQAMQSLITANRPASKGHATAEIVAIAAVKVARALLAELEKETR